MYRTRNERNGTYDVFCQEHCVGNRAATSLMEVWIDESAPCLLPFGTMCYTDSMLGPSSCSVPASFHWHLTKEIENMTAGKPSLGPLYELRAANSAAIFRNPPFENQRC